MVLVEILSRIIDQGFRFPEAVAAPRFSVGTSGLTLEVTDGAAWTAEQMDRLKSWGIKAIPSKTAMFGIFHGIHADPGAAECEGVADPRWGGAAACRRDNR